MNPWALIEAVMQRKQLKNFRPKVDIMIGKISQSDEKTLMVGNDLSEKWGERQNYVVNAIIDRVGNWPRR